MPTNYPGNKDTTATTLPNPSGTSDTSITDHALLHTNENDAIRALEDRVGYSTRTTPDNFSVLAYGAVADGTTDDTTAIQNAINAAHTAGGGNVQLARGTSIVSLLTLYSDVHIRGWGIDASILKLKAAANSAVLQSSGFAALTTTNGTGGIVNFGLYDFTVDANVAGQTSGTVAAVQIYGYGYILQNFRVKNSRGDGIYSEWSTSQASPGADGMVAQWVNVKTHDNGQHGINFFGPHDTQMVNIESFSNTSKGIYFRAGCGGVQLTNAHVWGLSHVNAIQIEDQVTFSNCAFEGSSDAQVVIGADNIIMGSCFVFAAAPGSQTNNWGIQIGIAGHATAQSNISGCHIQNCSSGAIKNVNNAGDNYIQAHVYQTSGPLIYDGGAGTGHAMPQDTIMFHAAGSGGPGSLFQFKSNGGNVLLGNNTVGAAATSSFVWVPYGSGPPTGVPTSVLDPNSAVVPLYWDATNNKLYFWSRGAAAWKGSAAFT